MNSFEKQMADDPRLADDPANKIISHDKIPLALSYLIAEVTALKNQIDSIEKQLGLGANRHLPMNVLQTAEFLDINERKLKKLITDREIPHYVRGNKYYFFQDELIKWLEHSRVSTIYESINRYYPRRK